ncbi:unnamed protein product [Arctia plantaginis]|uniref:Uncharacterized protein n=1 Tax=Arctia plantaginis TaxID=874455 RepID=A0A8S0ZB24_ARCPL|nr:unnamed protein product [Arctia plantaginis]
MKVILIVALALLALASADHVQVADGANTDEINIIPDPFFAGGAQAPTPNFVPDEFFAGGNQGGYQKPDIRPEYVQYGRPSRYNNP